MSEFNPEEWERIALLKEKQREKEVLETEKIVELSRLPLHKRLQVKGQEDKKAKFKKLMKEVFEKKVGEGFSDYWNSFLKTGVSINDYRKQPKG